MHRKRKQINILFSLRSVCGFHFLKFNKSIGTACTSLSICVLAVVRSIFFSHISFLLTLPILLHIHWLVWWWIIRHLWACETHISSFTIKLYIFLYVRRAFAVLCACRKTSLNSYSFKFLCIRYYFWIIFLCKHSLFRSRSQLSQEKEFMIMYCFILICLVSAFRFPFDFFLFFHSLFFQFFFAYRYQLKTTRIWCIVIYCSHTKHDCGSNNMQIIHSFFQFFSFFHFIFLLYV